MCLLRACTQSRCAGDVEVEAVVKADLGPGRFALQVGLRLGSEEGGRGFRRCGWVGALHGVESPCVSLMLDGGTGRGNVVEPDESR